MTTAWTAFDVASQAITRAPSLRAADAEVRAADETRDEAYWAGLPGLTLAARYTRQSIVEMGDLSGGLSQLPEGQLPEGLDFGGLTAQIPNQYAVTASLNARISELIFSMLPIYEASKHMQAAARSQREATKDAVSHRAHLVYYQVLRARAAQRITAASLALTKKNHADLHALFDAGMATSADLALSRASLADAQLSERQAVTNTEISEATMRTLLGLQQGAPLPLADGIGTGATDPDPTAQQLVDLARARRHERLALQSALAAAEHTASSHEGRRYPALTAFANADYSNPQPRSVPPQAIWRPAWNAGVMVSWSPTDAPLLASRAARAHQDTAKARANLAAFDDQLQTDAMGATFQSELAKSALQTADIRVAAADENYQMRRDLMNAGSDTAFNVLDAQTRLRQAQLQRIDAQLRLRVAQVEIRRIAGTLRDGPATTR